MGSQTVALPSINKKVYNYFEHYSVIKPVISNCFKHYSVLDEVTINHLNTNWLFILAKVIRLPGIIISDLETHVARPWTSQCLSTDVRHQ